MRSDLQTVAAAPAISETFLDVETGELLPVDVDHAYRVLEAVRSVRQRLGRVAEDVNVWIVEESRRLGTKTFHAADGDVTLSGGPTIDYDPVALADLLREAGCPEERVDAVVRAEITYRVDRAVLRQLVGANPDYAAAAELAKVETVKPWRASAKARK